MNPNNAVMSAKRSTSGQKPDISRILRLSLLYSVLTLGAVMFLLPLVWTISGSLKPPGEIFTVPIRWVPSQFQWETYQRVFTVFPFWTYVQNTLIIVVFAVMGQLISSVLVAYGFSRFRHPLNGPLFILVLSTMMIPGQVTMIPQYLVYKEFGWIDTYLPLIVPNYFAAAINIFLLRQFILGIPRELDESAKMDGASTLKILTKIIMPMCLPIMITIGIWTVNSNWNDFMGPLIYLNSPERFTLQIGIYNLNAGRQGITDFGLMFAASLITLLPNLILFAVGQKYFMSGIKITGAIKG
jgi:multiple sugar transport system permease protein